MNALLHRQALGVQFVCRKQQKPAGRSSLRVSASTDVWLPGADRPQHLRGSNEKLSGNRGFDPLNLGSDQDRLKWYAEAEKTNGRWAMAAVAGILGQEALGVQPAWYLHGQKEYWLPIYALTGLMFPIIGLFELKRYQGFKETGNSGVLTKFPFDPLGLDSEANREKEVKNGRLAMVAFVGFVVQALVVRSNGPIDDLTTHISNPFGNNILTNIGSLPLNVTK